MSTPPQGTASRDRDAETAQSAADRAYAFVKDQIVTGSYPGGTLISEGEASEALQISRTPIREAFLRLSAEGLLRLYPKRGALVVPVSASEIHDVLDARRLIEQHAARTAIAAGRHRELAAELRAILYKHSDPGTPRDARHFTELDQQFHGALVEAAGNRLLADFYAALRDRQLRMGTAALRRDPGRYDAILAEHAALADLIDTGNAEETADALAGHLAATRAVLAEG
ncbi:MAG TPA: GntR family transcriptional regulator [Streptosporangiaceae bacterium]|nr:GntR family transcriptional regulator [Streptosporangiaceae bacterium]